MCSENVVSLIAKLPTLLGIYSLCPWKLSWCPIKYGFKKMRLIWTEFGLRPWIQWYNVGGNSFLCDYYILYHWSYAFFFFLTNLYFVRCILREQQEKNVSTMNGFWQAHDLNIVIWEGKTYSDILLLWISFFQVIFVCVEVALSETLSGNFGS